MYVFWLLDIFIYDLEQTGPHSAQAVYYCLRERPNQTAGPDLLSESVNQSDGFFLQPTS